MVNCCGIWGIKRSGTCYRAVPVTPLHLATPSLIIFPVTARPRVFESLLNGKDCRLRIRLAARHARSFFLPGKNDCFVCECHIYDVPTRELLAHFLKCATPRARGADLIGSVEVIPDNISPPPHPPRTFLKDESRPNLTSL